MDLRGYDRRGLQRAGMCFVLAVLFLIAGLVFWNKTRTSADGRYGSVSLPGRQVVTLPAGHTDITFTEDLVNRTIDIPAFGLSIYGARTGKDAQVTFRDKSPIAVNGVTHAYVGSVDVPTAGRYDVRVTGRYAGLGQQLRFGISRRHGWAAWGAALVAVALVLLGFALRRRARPVPAAGLKSID